MKVRQHIKEHKAAYITGGICLVVGAAGSAAYFVSKPDIIQVARQINVFSPNSKQHVIQFIERSTPSKPIHLVGTQKYWDSISAAAKDTGVDRALISKNINGHLAEAVTDHVFELVDVAS